VHVVGVSELGRSLRALPYRLHPAEISHLQTLLSRTLLDAEAPGQLSTAELDPEPRGALPPGAHREPVAPRPAPLFVPVTTGALRSAARTGTRSGPRRGRRTWRRFRLPLRSRVSGPVAARLLLAALLAVAAIAIGPALVRGALETVRGQRAEPVPAAVIPVTPGPEPSPAASAP
jgi:hypothetical protein